MHKKYGDFRCLSIYFEPDDEAAKHECRNPTCCLLEILMKILPSYTEPTHNRAAGYDKSMLF